MLQGPDLLIPGLSVRRVPGKNYIIIIFFLQHKSSSYNLLCALGTVLNYSDVQSFHSPNHCIKSRTHPPLFLQMENQGAESFQKPAPSYKAIIKWHP